jgi:ABC-type phosphate/phosphonate transport system substrate-binding protein
MRSGAGRVVGLVAMICCCMAAVGWSQSADVVRVGVVVFESGSGDASPDVMWQELFSKWQERSGLTFVYAKGTHSDVLHWMRNRIVDAAVLPAGGLVQERKAEREADRGDVSGASWSMVNPHFEYVATLGYTPATTAFAEEDRRRPGFHFFSRSVCVVSKDSELDTQEELLQATRQGKLQFLMVHPYSASGSMLPREFLLE